MRKSQVRWKGHVLFIFTIHINSLLNSQNTLWRVITNCIFIWTITGLITYIFDEPFTRFPHFSAFLVTPWSRALLEKLTSSKLVKKFPTFYGTQKSLPYSQVPVTCPYPESDQSWPCPPSHFLKIHLNINPPIYSWVFQVAAFPQVSPPKTCIHLSSPLHTCYIPCPSNFSRFDHPNTRGEEWKSLSSSCSFLLLSPNILLNTLFSYTQSLHSSLNVTDQVSHPYKTTDKVIVLYILIFIFLDTKLEDTRFCTEL